MNEEKKRDQIKMVNLLKVFIFCYKTLNEDLHNDIEDWIRKKWLEFEMLPILNNKSKFHHFFFVVFVFFIFDELSSHLRYFKASRVLIVWETFLISSFPSN